MLLLHVCFTCMQIDVMMSMIILLHIMHIYMFCSGQFSMAGTTAVGARKVLAVHNGANHPDCIELSKMISCLRLRNQW